MRHVSSRSFATPQSRARYPTVRIAAWRCSRPHRAARPTAIAMFGDRRHANITGAPHTLITAAWPARRTISDVYFIETGVGWGATRQHLRGRENSRCRPARMANSSPPVGQRNVAKVRPKTLIILA